MADVLTPDEVAASLGCSTKTVYRLVAAQKIAGVRLGGRVLIARAELDRILAAAGADRDVSPPNMAVGTTATMDGSAPRSRRG